MRCERVSFGLENLVSDYKAIEHFQKILDLWKDTNPGLSLGKVWQEESDRIGIKLVKSFINY